MGERILLGIAPMEGITSFPMRLWLHMAAMPEYATTPFLRATQNYPTDHIDPDFAPEFDRLSGYLSFQLTPQIMASEPKHFLRASKYFLKRDSVVELNCGCPTPNGAGALAGSGILREPQLFANHLSEIIDHIGPDRLAVKMRVGFAATDEFASLLEVVKSLPLARLTVHGRTRKQMYKGQSRWDLIQSAAAECEFPVWGSGDITNHVNLKSLCNIAPSISGAIIGRGLLCNPWIFTELRNGSSITICKKALLYALISYALIQQLYIENSMKLISGVAQGKVGHFCGLSLEMWRDETLMLIAMLGQPPAIDRINLSPTVYMRFKLLWSNLRLSLPSVFHCKTLLRVKNFSEFVSQFETILLEADDRFEVFAPDVARVD